ncbi:MAG: DUF11 domain-containing protein, partial [Firmicutes bacterium]|nr:DUF11 domain-containing protein [Bacillota bacterium]
TYTITYANNTGKVATVTVEDTIPQYTTYNEDASPAATYADGKLTWTIEDVAPGATGTVTFSVTVDDDANGKTIVNDADVRDGENESTTNAVTTSIPVKEVTDEAGTDIDGEGVQVGDILTYNVSFTIGETGLPVTAATVKDTIPTGTEYVEGSAAGEWATTIDDSTKTIVWKFEGDEENTLAPGTYTATFQVRVTEDALALETIDNTAIVNVNDDPDVETNTVTNTPETGNLTISKTITGPEGYEVDKDAEFTFTVKLYDKTETELKGEYAYSGSYEGKIKSGGTVTLKHGESITIQNLPAGGIYEVEETVIPEGYAVNGDNPATGEITDGATVTAAFENKYTASGDAEIEATKKLVGRDWLEGETFTFELLDSTGKTVGDPQTVSKADQKAEFLVEYTAEDIGTHTYTIVETGTLPNGVTKSGEIKVTVEVTDNFDGTLGTKVTYEDDNNTIINTYVPTPVNAQINVNKTIDGYVTSDKGSSDNVFEFTLYDKDGKQVGDKITITTKDGTGTASFAPIQYTEAGEYTYTVKETLGSAAGYTYSTIEYPVVVTVTDDPINAKLEASVSYGDYTVTSGDETLLDVINEFDMTDVDVVLTLTKIIDDQSNSAPDGTFTFKLYKDSVSEENFVEEKTITTNGLTGSAEFSKLTFDKSGEYIYVVVEEAGDVNGFTYDTSEHTYKIIIDDNFDAAILEVNEDSTLEAEITNIYKAKETSNILKVKKEINDTSGSAYETTFTFTLADADCNKIDEVTVVGPEEGEFKAIEYDKAGTYEYTITEVAGDDKGYEYDTTQYKVTVTVEDQNGELVATSAYISKTGESQTSLTITNTYDPEDAKIVIQALKTVDDITGGAAGNPKTFTFELLDADGNVIETVSRVGGGIVTFSELTYSKVGEYNYTVREVAGDDKGYTYDTSEYPVTVTVTDPDKDGILKAAITVGDSVEFINPYEAEPTSAKIQVNKALAGRDLVEGEFTFEMVGPDGKVYTATNTASGKVTFDKIKYTMPGDYTYVVSEVVPDDTKGVLFDEGTITVVVKVTDDGNGQLAAEVQYPDDKTFNNQYEPEGTYTPEVKKVMKGRDLKKNEFTFKMVGPDGKVYTAKNDADGNVVFDELEFGVDDIDQTYTYTITEKKGDLKYVTYDGHKVTLTLTITDNGDGTLNIKADYDGSKTFTNKYKKPTPPKTGDTTQVLPYTMMLTFAVLGLILVFRRRKAVKK